MVSRLVASSFAAISSPSACTSDCVQSMAPRFHENAGQAGYNMHALCQDRGIACSFFVTHICCSAAAMWSTLDSLVSTNSSYAVLPAAAAEI